MKRVLGSCIATVSVLVALGCGPKPPVDAEAPLTAGMADVADKCRRTRFLDGSASDTLTIAAGVVVRIVPAEKSHKYKLANLGSGRILARLDNQENGDYANLALYGDKGQACWFVWEDKDSGELRSKYVSWNGTGETPDRNFHIDFHPQSHPSEKSEWREDRQQGLGAQAGLFMLAAAGSPVLQVGLWMWTTCLSNGCCRSRQ